MVGMTLTSPLSDATEEIVSVDVPVLVTVTLSCLPDPTVTFPNATLPGVIENPGSTPVPLNATLSGEPDASCAKMMFPVSGPLFVGLNVM